MCITIIYKMFFSFGITVFLLVFKGESTNIAFNYKDGVIRIPKADGAHDSALSSLEDLKLNLPLKFTFPLSLAYDPSDSTLFVADPGDHLPEILSFSLAHTPVQIRHLVPKTVDSLAETMTYDPLDKRLFWTDANQHSLWSINISSGEENPVKLFTDQSIHNLRGLTLDYCNKVLYWTERKDSVLPPVIVMADLETNSVQVFRESHDETYYQGIHYDPIHQELIWAETKGDFIHNASCIIKMVSLLTRQESASRSFKTCFPFDLTSDSDYIYWSDWAREGIMRLDRNLQNNSLVTLLNTPTVQMDKAHYRSMGIVNLRNTSLKDRCSRRLTTSISPIQETEKVLIPLENQTSRIHELLEDEGIGLTTRQGNDHYVAAQSSASSLCGVKHYRLQLIIIVISTLCLFFMGTSILLFRNLALQQGFLKTLKTILLMAPATDSVPRQAKKVKAHRTFGHRSKILDDQLCQRSADDGVRIDIEDCCQMTLCDKPCFTSIKKGKKKKFLTKAVSQQNLIPADECD